MMNLIIHTTFLILLHVTASALADVPLVDLDGDGKSDQIIQQELQAAEGGLSAQRDVIVQLSSRLAPLHVQLQSATSSLVVYPARSGDALIVDRSERSSRDAAEFSYSVFRGTTTMARFACTSM